MLAGIQELLGDIQSAEVYQDYRMAKFHYLKGLQIKPNQISLLIKLARAQEKLREFDDAISTLQKVIRRDNDHF
jgi:tetratricopeptide (TPR) repeat protein